MRTLHEDLAVDLDRTFFDTSRFGEPCTYRQGQAEPLDVRVIVEKVDHTVQEDEGFRQQSPRFDCLIPAAELTEITVRSSDRITRTRDSAVFEVLPPDKFPVAEADETGDLLRLHTLQVA